MAETKTGRGDAGAAIARGGGTQEDAAAHGHGRWSGAVRVWPALIAAGPEGVVVGAAGAF